MPIRKSPPTRAKPLLAELRQRPNRLSMSRVSRSRTTTRSWPPRRGIRTWNVDWLKPRGRRSEMQKIMNLGAAVALTLAPTLAFAQSGQSPSAAPPAATISDLTISKAGAALHDVAQVSQKYQGQMESASPAQKQTLSEQANAEAVQAIQSHGLSVEQYTGVIRTAKNDPQLKQRLLSAADQGR